MTLATSIGSIILWTALVSLFGLVAGLCLLGIDRKLAAHMQARIGPRIAPRQIGRDGCGRSCPRALLESAE